jgi:hypothetical protein
VIIYSFLLLFIWMALARGLPDVIDELREKKFAPTPPWWALVAAAGLLWGLDTFYRTETAEAKSQKALKKVVALVDQGDYKRAMSELQDIALSPPWIPRDTYDESPAPGF